MKSHHLGRATFGVLSLGVSLLACSSDDSPSSPPQQKDPTCTAANQCMFIAAGTTEVEIQDRLGDAKSGDTIKFGEGTFSFTRQLALPPNVKNFTVLGAGREKTVLDFQGQTATSNDSVFAQYVEKIRFEGFTVKDGRGNGIKVLQGTNVVFRNVKTYWTSADEASHGAYGLYPVQSTNVLIENSVTIGASDTGIYVGQSKNIIVRNNDAHGNVAGIEIENCFTADVHDNDVYDNASGILIFDLPNLEQKGGHDIRVFNNKVHENNHRNFSPGGLLQNVPAGTGFFVLANTNVEVFGNTFEKNGTTQTSILSYFILGEEIKDTGYTKPYPTNVYVHDNTYANGGTDVDGTKELGLLLSITSFPNTNEPKKRVPEIIYDGITPPTSSDQVNPNQVCWKNNKGTVESVNLHFDKFTRDAPNLAQILEMNPTVYGCELPPLPEVKLPE
ncbi:right-handed parallel beta-helix repeat-containing protein [Pendulispora brunnea]|uniref:Right-handed parallel beta-helix repeat-containing protein n=1 Tax=Pendulispora brunnea TaxID=2905690 RepID=A0ABZ2K093_9BACT